MASWIRNELGQCAGLVLDLNEWAYSGYMGPQNLIFSLLKFLQSAVQEHFFFFQACVAEGKILKSNSNWSMMAMFVSGLHPNCSGLIYPSRAKVPCGIQRHNGIKFNDCSALQIPRQKIQYFHGKHYGVKHVLSVGSNRHHLSFGNDLPEEPFWLSLIKNAIWGLKSLFVFLAEQPSQLKYIEWPGFQSTLKTAILTLVLVALLIVALSSVDSALLYLLALLLRRTP